MCSKTLSSDQWGLYSEGVVSSSGYGDGMYDLYTATKKNDIVAMILDFGLRTKSIKNIVTEDFLPHI